MATENGNEGRTADAAATARAAPKRGERLETRADRLAARERLAEGSEKARKAVEERNAELNKDADFSPAGVDRVEASGAIIEDEAVAAIPLDHPAVDNNPRAGTTVRQNNIDFNDPTLTTEEAVEANLDTDRR